MKKDFIDEEFASEEEKQYIERMTAENEERCRLAKKMMEGKPKDIIIFLKKYRPEEFGTN